MPFKAVVVSTGGGAVVKRQNWGYMQHGVVVWLTGSPELLSRRALRDGTASRPLLSQNNGETLQAVSPSALVLCQPAACPGVAGVCKPGGIRSTACFPVAGLKLCLSTAETADAARLPLMLAVRLCCAGR